MELNVHPETHGLTEHGCGKVADASVENVVMHDELGAGLVVYVGGREVVGSWGIADQRSNRLDGRRSIVPSWLTRRRIP
jgi:hypothetical protein